MATIVKLNVGGKVFHTTTETLKRSGFFRQRMDELVSTAGEYFIDRSSDMFEHVLNFLRDPDYPYPADYSYILELDRYDVDGKAEYKEKSKSINERLDNIDRGLDIIEKVIKEPQKLCRNKGCANKRFRHEEKFDYCTSCGKMVATSNINNINEIKYQTLYYFFKSVKINNENVKYGDGKCLVSFGGNEDILLFWMVLCNNDESNNYRKGMKFDKKYIIYLYNVKQIL